MSRLDDLIDLIQTTNEVYFITAPGRVRTAYILVDDIIELALKTYLQERTFQRREDCLTVLETAGIVNSDRHRSQFKLYCEGNTDFIALCNALGLRGSTAVTTLQSHTNPFEPLQHWSTNDPNAFVVFEDVVNEVKTFYSPGDPIVALLDDTVNRHKTRNKFYHDHHQTGLTIDDDKCLRALCAMFSLMEQLFPDTPVHEGFQTLVQQNPTVRCQIGVLRLKLAAHGSSDLEEPYNEALKQFELDHRLNMLSVNFQHSVLHTISERFFAALREQFRNKIAKLELRVNQINNMRRPQERHQLERTDKARLIQILREQLNGIEILLGTP